MPWRSAAVVMLDADGRYRDADERALELLGVASVDDLRNMSPEEFQPVPQDPAEVEAFRRAFAAGTFEGLLAEGAVRRTDGSLVRVRTAIVADDSGGYRALFYPIEWPTENVTPRVYRIADVLSEWRSAERKLVAVEPDSDEGRSILDEIALLRDQYQQLFQRVVGQEA